MRGIRPTILRGARKVPKASAPRLHERVKPWFDMLFSGGVIAITALALNAWQNIRQAEIANRQIAQTSRQRFESCLGKARDVLKRVQLSPTICMPATRAFNPMSDIELHEVESHCRECLRIAEDSQEVGCASEWAEIASIFYNIGELSAAESAIRIAKQSNNSVSEATRIELDLATILAAKMEFDAAQKVIDGAENVLAGSKVSDGERLIWKLRLRYASAVVSVFRNPEAVDQPEALTSALEMCKAAPQTPAVFQIESKLLALEGRNREYDEWQEDDVTIPAPVTPPVEVVQAGYRPDDTEQIGLRVLISYHSKSASEKQLQVIKSNSLNRFLVQSCQAVDGNPQLRVWDEASDTEGDSPYWMNLWSDLRPKSGNNPTIHVFTDSVCGMITVPDTDDEAIRFIMKFKPKE